MTEAAPAERFEQAAQTPRRDPDDRDAATPAAEDGEPELGDRDAFGLKLGPAGAVVQVFQMRGGRVVERIELVTESGSALKAGQPTADDRRRPASAGP